MSRLRSWVLLSGGIVAATVAMAVLHGQQLRESRALASERVDLLREAAGTVVGQTPDGGAGALPGDLVRLNVASGAGDGRYTDLPMAVGGLVTRARTMFARSGIGVDVIEVQVPGHPYAGTGRVAAQYPVSRMPSRHAARVTLWIVLP